MTANLNPALDDFMQFSSSGRSATVTFVDEPDLEPLFCPIISVDDHALEPPTLFADRLPAKLQEHAPYFSIGEDNIPAWSIDGVRVPLTMTDGSCGRIKSEWSIVATDYSEMRRSVWDSRARLHDMDITGVWASVCFGSTIWGFAGKRFSTMADADLGLQCLRAYNDWMIDEWCAAAPERYIPCQLPWLSDADIAADQILHNAARGFRAVSFSENPEGLGFPNIYDRSWDPFFRACEETGTVINLHVGSSGRTNRPCSSSVIEVILALFPVSGMEALFDWTFALIPLRFPGLKIVLSEAGASWVPMALERLRRLGRQTELQGRSWPVDAPEMEEVARRNFAYTSIEDPLAFQQLDIVGEDALMVETDYPHQDSTWPDCQQMIRHELENLSSTQIRKVCFENAARIYRHPLPPAEMIAGSAIGAGSQTI